MPGVQLVNMRPNAPGAQTKTVATVSPRVVIGNPHMVATRPTNPGVSYINNTNNFFSLSLSCFNFVITNFNFSKCTYKHTPHHSTHTY